MEHRCSLRMPLDIPVLLDAAGESPRQCRIANIGAEGAYVRAPGLACPRNALVGLVVPAAPGKRPWRLDAMVVHVGPGGAGLLFLEPDSDLVARIVQSARGRGMTPPAHAARGGSRAAALRGDADSVNSAGVVFVSQCPRPRQ